MSKELNTNWPDPERPGYPMFPERGGWHIIIDDGHCACYWNPGNELWWNENKRIYVTLRDISEKITNIDYIGPVLTCAQIERQEETIKALQEELNAALAQIEELTL